MKSNLFTPPIQRPRPYTCITEVDPWSTPFPKTIHWALYRGFYSQHHEDYGSRMEPLDMAFTE